MPPGPYGGLSKGGKQRPHIPARPPRSPREKTRRSKVQKRTQLFRARGPAPVRPPPPPATRIPAGGDRARLRAARARPLLTTADGCTRPPLVLRGLINVPSHPSPSFSPAKWAKMHSWNKGFSIPRAIQSRQTRVSVTQKPRSNAASGLRIEMLWWVSATPLATPLARPCLPSSLPRPRSSQEAMRQDRGPLWSVDVTFPTEMPRLLRDTQRIGFPAKLQPNCLPPYGLLFGKI